MSEIFSPKSLYKQCIIYIACNQDLLDSLCGLPDIFGKDLFDAMLDNKSFHPVGKDRDSVYSFTEAGLKTLNMFDEAFPTNILSDLNLSNFKNTNIKWSDFIHSFQNIYKLEISHQKNIEAILGKMSLLKSLEVLIARDTGLNDKMINTVTLPYRLYKDRSTKIQVLDIADNLEVSFSSFHNLCVFQNIKAINLTQTGFKLSFEKVYQLKDEGWIIKRDDPGYFVENKGWAKKLISKLEDEDSQMELKVNQRVSKFYGRKDTTRRSQPVGKLEYMLLTRNTPIHNLPRKTKAASCGKKRKLSHVYSPTSKTNDSRSIRDDSTKQEQKSKRHNTSRNTLLLEDTSNDELFKQYFSKGSTTKDDSTNKVGESKRQNKSINTLLLKETSNDELLKQYFPKDSNIKSLFQQLNDTD